MEGEAEQRQIVDVVEERADGTLLLEWVDITQPWLSAQSLAMAAANRSGQVFKMMTLVLCTVRIPFSELLWKIKS